MTAPTPMPDLAPGEQLLCQECWEPIDPLVWPSHPAHDLTERELAAAARADEDRAARAQAKREAEVRADEARARKRKTSTSRRRKR